MENDKDYIWDIFISYRRNTAVEIWIEKYFYPELMRWLPEELPPNKEPSIFFDKRIKPGTKWPNELRRALKCTNLLIPVLNSPYFGSPWCLAELNTILERERCLELSCEEQTEGLIYPIVFADGKYFSEDIKNIQYRDMKKYASVADAFRDSKEFLGFESEVKQVAKDIAYMLDKSHPFDQNWPVVEPQSIKKNLNKLVIENPRFAIGGIE